MFSVAFYKGTRPGIQGLYNILVRWWMRSPYTHCEMIFSDGISASSSFLDGGVRFKHIEYKPEHWDIVELPCELEQSARNWFEEHEGDSYDVIGNLGFVIGSIDDSKRKWFCSEVIMAALGVEEPGKFSPSTAMPVVRAIARIWSTLSSSTQS